MIKCTQQFNTRCLKCNCVKHSIVRIGAFIMCNGCFLEEFDENMPEFEPDSPNGKKYYVWLEQYKERGEIL